MSDIQKAIDFTDAISFKAEDGTPMFPQATEKIKATICSALEKQIPQKIIPFPDDVNPEFLPLGKCPTCGTTLCTGEYCENCGQKLEWGEAE